VTQVGEGVAVPVPPPVQPEKQHQIAVRLVPLPVEKAPSAYPWWPPRVRSYGGTAFSADVTDGHHDGKLNGYGVARFDNIPAGTCSLSFPKFYDDIEAALKSLTCTPDV
jgi:hypothetical protein